MPSLPSYDNDTVSTRIMLLRFPLIIGVVFIHYQASMVSSHSSFTVDFVRNLISGGIAQIAVPLFFLISGYLFFWGFDFSGRKYARKLKSRTRTLLVPFLFWNIATLSIYALGEMIPATKGYFANRYWPPVHAFGIRDYANAILGVFAPYPIAPQLWYVRDLMVLVLLVPVINFIITRRLALPFTLAICTSWFLGNWPFLWPNAEATLFFSLGAFLSSTKKDLSCIDRHGLLIFVFFLPALFVDALFVGNVVEQYFRCAMILLGVPSIWWLTGYAVRTEKLRSWLISLSSSSFFVYAAHEPSLTVVRKVAFKLFSPQSGTALLCLYFLIPSFLVVILVIAHRFLKAAVPSFIDIITGSRKPAATLAHPRFIATTPFPDPSSLLTR